MSEYTRTREPLIGPIAAIVVGCAFLACVIVAATVPGPAVLAASAVVAVACVIPVVFGWSSVFDAPYAPANQAVGAAVGVVAVIAAVFEPWIIALVAAISVLAAFVGEMRRPDGRHDLADNVSLSYLLGAMGCATACWVLLIGALPGAVVLASPVAVFGTAGRYTGVRRVRRGSRTGHDALMLIARPAVFGLIGSAAVAIPLMSSAVSGTENLGLLVALAVVMCLGFGIVAGLVDTVARPARTAQESFALALIPVCALGVIAYAGAGLLA